MEWMERDLEKLKQRLLRGRARRARSRSGVPSVLDADENPDDTVLSAEAAINEMHIAFACASVNVLRPALQENSGPEVAPAL